MNKDEKFISELIRQGVFSVDNQGRVWRHRIRLSRHNDYRDLPKKRRAEYRSNGYYTLDVRYNGACYRTKAHRIVWIYFHGDIDNNLTINHKNGIKTDNRIGNLELVTISDNVRHAHKNGITTGAELGENHPMSKIDGATVKQIRDMYKTGNYSQSRLGEIFGLSQGHIGRIIRFERWTHL